MPGPRLRKWTDLQVRIAALDHLDASDKPLTANEVAAGIKAPLGMVRDALEHLALKTGEATVIRNRKTGDVYTTAGTACAR